MRLALKAALAVVAVVGVGALATGASGAFRANSVVPLFCTSDTIPAGSELKLRMRWVVRNSGQADKFLSSQKLSWTVSSSSGTVLASRVPSNPEYGNLTYWSPKVHQSGTDINNDGVVDDVYYMDYLAPTGITLAAGESVTVAYTLTANAKTDDGFGFKFDAFQTIASGSSCTVTGV
jgi:hypothetical protein